jgi:putative endonuclease
MPGGYVYIPASKSGVLYTGVTSALQERIRQHRMKLIPGFTTRYNVNRLVYYERLPSIVIAIAREKEVKGWSRAKRVALIESRNPTWRDLAEGHIPLARD